MREKGRQIAESFCQGRREEDWCAKTERRGFLFIDFFNGPDPLEQCPSQIQRIKSLISLISN